MFPSNNTPKVASYEERAQELKMKIQRTHSGRTDTMKRPIHINKVYNVAIGIKCYEKNKYKLKLKRVSRSHSIEMPRIEKYML